MTPTPLPFLRSAVYLEESLDDPAETYHEASRLYPALAARQGEGIARLAASPALQELALRQRRRNPHLPSVSIAPARPPEVTVWEALARRRSRPPLPGTCVDAATLSLLLRTAYGTASSGRRTVPSGGALYPLDLYAVALRVRGLAPGVWQFDPIDATLARLASDPPDLAAAVPAPELVEHACVVLFLAATFWRTRFKYGQRGYRFALLEAGHAAQNVVLAAAALELTVLPLGGFYDAEVDALLGLDGVDQSVLYGLVVGGTES
ncbi:MAG TPA: SagB/ThcOx family dehydrogenase [Gaiellaceae bacterium]|nr:SagB/ThcOx family dehydrogenase [Gaiellaceae bacterium]